MRFLPVCAGAALALTAMGQTAFVDTAQAYSRLSDEFSPVLVIPMRHYRWNVPTFRMAGQDAFAVIHVINSSDYAIRLRMKCSTGFKRIHQMSRNHRIGPHETLEMDTRRFHHPMQKSPGVDVDCIFNADGSAKVLAWFVDKQNEKTSWYRARPRNAT